MRNDYQSHIFSYSTDETVRRHPYLQYTWGDVYCGSEAIRLSVVVPYENTSEIMRILQIIPTQHMTIKIGIMQLKR